MVKFIKGSIQDLIDWGSEEDEVDAEKELEEFCKSCPEQIYWPKCDPSISCPYQNEETGDN